jgi:hypothetical protein
LTVWSYSRDRRCGIACSATLAAATLVCSTFVADAREPLGSARPQIVTRQSWGAKPALPGLVPQKIIGIIVHHTAAKQNTRVPFPTKLRNLQSYSQQIAEFAPGRRKPAWPDLPYHFYIDASGTIAEGRDVRFAGSTNTNYDPSGYVQVALEGNFDVEQPTAPQLEALKKVLLWQSIVHGVPVDRITIHKQHASTACPGKNLAAAIPSLLAILKAGPR